MSAEMQFCEGGGKGVSAVAASSILGLVAFTKHKYRRIPAKNPISEGFATKSGCDRLANRDLVLCHFVT